MVDAARHSERICRYCYNICTDVVVSVRYASSAPVHLTNTHTLRLSIDCAPAYAIPAPPNYYLFMHAQPKAARRDCSSAVWHCVSGETTTPTNDANAPARCTHNPPPADDHKPGASGHLPMDPAPESRSRLRAGVKQYGFLQLPPRWAFSVPFPFGISWEQRGPLGINGPFGGAAALEVVQGLSVHIREHSSLVATQQFCRTADVH